VLTLERGRWDPRAEDLGSRPLFGLLVLDGALVRRASVGTRAAAELLGPGDLIRPDLECADQYAAVAQGGSWSVITPVRLARLDHDLIAGLAGVGEILPELVARALQRARALTLQLAISQIPNLAARLHVYLWHLADRWGIRDHEAVRLTLRLPQELLADLVAAHRASVNAAAQELTGQGLVRCDEGYWRLFGDSPPAFGAAALRSA
jgi:hypothetical protein